MGESKHKWVSKLTNEFNMTRPNVNTKELLLELAMLLDLVSQISQGCALEAPTVDVAASHAIAKLPRARRCHHKASITASRHVLQLLGLVGKMSE